MIKSNILFSSFDEITYQAKKISSHARVYIDFYLDSFSFFFSFAFDDRQSKKEKNVNCSTCNDDWKGRYF